MARSKRQSEKPKVVTSEPLDGESLEPESSESVPDRLEHLIQIDEGWRNLEEKWQRRVQENGQPLSREELNEYRGELDTYRQKHRIDGPRGGDLGESAESVHTLTDFADWLWSWLTVARLAKFAGTPDSAFDDIVEEAHSTADWFCNDTIALGEPPSTAECHNAESKLSTYYRWANRLGGDSIMRQRFNFEMDWKHRHPHVSVKSGAAQMRKAYAETHPDDEKANAKAFDNARTEAKRQGWKPK